MGDSIFMSTHEPIPNSVVTQFRIVTSAGSLLARWENRGASYDLVRIVNQKMYAETVGKILVYGK